MNSNVIEDIVENDLCIGCGACVGLCPKNALVMTFNKYGEYNPVNQGICLDKCGLCLKVCPFYDGNKNESVLGNELYGSIKDVKYLFETGYYLDSYVGYSHDFRQTGASGGIATWLLTTLLKKNIVDYVICVTSNSDSEKLFKYQIYDDLDSVVNSSGSVYYPIEMSQVIQMILNKPGSYAIIGLPCFLKGLRLACQKNKKLGNRISVTIGLTCGQMKSKHYTTYLSNLAKVGGNLQKVYYRGKSSDERATNYYFYCINEKASEGKIFWNEGISEAWVNRWFTPNACNFCDDTFAELADIAVMDAWLPEYSHDARGTSLILVRSSLMFDLISDGVNNNQIFVHQIPIQKLIKSQAGVITVKRNNLPYRLYLAQRNGHKIPSKRINPINNISIIPRLEVKIKDNMQKISAKSFINNYNYSDLLLNVKGFRYDMQPSLNKLNLLHLISKYLMFLSIFTNYILCLFRRNKNGK